VPEGDEGGVIGGGEGEAVALGGISGVCSGAVRKMMVSGGFEDFEGSVGERTDLQGV